MATVNWVYPTGSVISGTTYIKDTDNYIQAAMDDLVKWVNSTDAYTTTGLAQSMVDLATAQTISGDKTFTGAMVADAITAASVSASGGLTGDLTGNVTGDVTGNADTATSANTATTATTTTGNAGTATKLQTARTIDITGDITATAQSFDGSANIAISAAVNNDSHTHSSSTLSDITSGIYNTVSTGITNVTSTVGDLCMYQKIGNVVSVSGSVQVNVTTSGLQTAVRMSLPIAAGFASSDELAGSASGSALDRAYLYAYTSTNQAYLSFTPASSGSKIVRFSFAYNI